MPTYEYKCGSCEYNFDTFQSMKDEPLQICPKCGEGKLRRLINGGTGIIFKGDGFYSTDKKGKGAKSEKVETNTTETKTANANTGNAACSNCAGSDSPACPKAVNS